MNGPATGAPRGQIHSQGQTGLARSRFKGWQSWGERLFKQRVRLAELGGGGARSFRCTGNHRKDEILT